jgi:hypothetical protein
VALFIGLLLSLAGIVLLFNVGGAGDLVIHRVTSRSLGQLAPGFAATRFGFKIYAALLGAVGLTVIGIAMAEVTPVAGLIVVASGVLSFVLLSVVAVRGEVTTYRALKR